MGREKERGRKIESLGAKLLQGKIEQEEKRLHIGAQSHRKRLQKRRTRRQRQRDTPYVDGLNSMGYRHR